MIFGDWAPASQEISWRTDAITISKRTKPGIREDSVTATGLGVVKVGMHYDMIIMDDVVSNKNTATSEQLQKTLEYYRLAMSILDPGAELIVIGTRYSYDDLYGHIQENEASNYDILVRSAYKPDGSLYFPTRLTKSFLEEQRKTQGGYIFSAQYCNKPVDEENAMFKQRWLLFTETFPLALRHYLLVDPAASMEDDADFSGIVVCGIDVVGNILIREAFQVKVTVYDLVDQIFELVKKYNIHSDGCLGLETIAFQKTLKYILVHEMNRRNFYFGINELKNSSRRSKTLRIRALQPYFENGKIFLQKNQEDLIEQILRFPRVKNDDIIDALAGILEIMHPADEIKEDKWQKSGLTGNEISVWKELEKFTTRKVKRTKI
jgi:predicted phage terminase large subunit-like protein